MSGTYWSIRGRVLPLDQRPLVMGILNVTPDSFSDGNRYVDPESALAHARLLVHEGADIIDIGGESSRPGATSVTEAEELGRVIPVVAAVAQALPHVAISIDTVKAEVARQAVRAGAKIINDISGLRGDPRMARVAATSGAGLVLMHMLGSPQTMQQAPNYYDLMGQITTFLVEAGERAQEAGVARSAIVIDPGIGFGKSFDHNWEILNRLDEICAFGYPVLVGASRKRFLRAEVGDDPEDLESATLATTVAACLKGARIVRVHRVRSHRRAVEVVAALLRETA